MSLKLNERYPGRFDNPTADYPQGAFKNRTTPTAKDGSYLERDWANDKEGFFQSLLSLAGSVPNGLVDKVGASQYFDALIKISRLSTYGADTGTANTYTVAFSPAVAVLTDGIILRFKAKTANSGASTFSPNGLTAKPVVGLNKSALQGGEITANGSCVVVWSAAGDHWILLSSTGGALQIAAPSQSNHAVPFSWLPKRTFGANDYIRIPDVPGGLIIQWGAASFGSASDRIDVTASLPIAFPSAHLKTIPTVPTASDDVFVGWNPASSTLSVASFTVRDRVAGVISASAVHYISLGF
ncbi:hypothetical protein QEM27_003195 [Pseudomonas putida]|nr:hypothetical protein [Pseudomonas putida]EKT8868117.1 hypothetical protein [Pseudomonas putida]